MPIYYGVHSTTAYYNNLYFSWIEFKSILLTPIANLYEISVYNIRYFIMTVMKLSWKPLGGLKILNVRITYHQHCHCQSANRTQPAWPYDV